ncbi:AfsR/SARP family transcriptional regulator [Longispora fulva]|uniref:DNA-binding SARP family transcriptional activator/tetratricopeptide (TPR) repeat protein n=1 Tax=Longispora fulva TaxID=619741 RepID=A0A8J7G8W0_9ACTN|nr:BTAD domain-containing putative transcriptional regulator [Longispora fulva]MBG6135858.1 DNA-binding SARP family transcriptional activator/tetratricopeptide (TPR) repeat protein [Longispora fulva]
MEFGVLGEIEARSHGQRIDIGHIRQQCVLAVLLVEANHPVPRGTLADRVWGQARPRSVDGSLYSYLSRLRRALQVTGVDIERRPGGYVLTADPVTVDMHHFRRLVDEARAAVGDERALHLFDTALRLWRGQAFGNLDTPWLGEVRDTLDRERLAAELDRDDLRLRTGQHSTMLAELHERAVAHPLDERVAGQLMLALYRSGRQADALEQYDRTRRLLATELGSDPGQPLRALHLRILNAHPDLLAAPAAPAVPRQLPADSAQFIGRAADLDRLDATLGGGPVLISGPPGAGKTALAVHWAHRHAALYPHGQLYVNLNGYAPSAPLDPGHVLAAFLRALGVPPEAVPADREEAAALYRSLLADRRILVVLDNARTAEQVRALLPAGPGCLALITSRDPLAGLLARDGAQVVAIDMLAPDEAVALLARTVPPARAAAEPLALTELARRCAYLPLALRIAAANLTSQPRRSISGYVAELDRGGRLAALTADGDEMYAVRAAYTLSYRALSPTARILFALLGAVSLAEVSAGAASALLDVSPPDAARVLAELADAHLLQRTAADRYTFHDLLRELAVECAAGPVPDHRAAADRVLRWYLHTAHRAYLLLYPPGRQSPPDPAQTPAHLPDLVDYDGALAWCEAERANFLTVMDTAAAHARPDLVSQLANALISYYDVTKHWDDWLRSGRLGADAAGRLGAHGLRARLLNFMGVAHGQRDELDQAVAHHERALAICREIDDPELEGVTLTSLGVTYDELGRREEAVTAHLEAVRIRGELGDTDGESMSLSNLGHTYHRMGKHAQAIECMLAALPVQRRLNSLQTVGDILHGLGEVHHELGRHAEAIDYFEQGLQAARAVQHRWGVALLLDGLGRALHATGQSHRAHACWAEAVDLWTGLNPKGTAHMFDRRATCCTGTGA